MKLSAFETAYVTCALWSSTDEDGNPMDSFSVSGIATDTLNKMVADCKAFQSNNEADLAIVAEVCDDTRSGHDFWLNRNGHGSGFWDEYFGEDTNLRAAFVRLSNASKAEGSFNLYIGDDEKVHGS